MRMRSISVLGLAAVLALACGSVSSSGDAGTGGSGGGASGAGGARGGAGGGPCWSSTDCGGGAICTPPGSPLCGGACIGVQHPCSSDDDCHGDAAAPSICEAVLCSCPSGMGCVPGCMTNADCLEGQTCASNHHCLATTCSASANTCPADFTCNISGTGGGACARKSCQSDGQCSFACVLGFCYGAAGTCRLPVP
jgi:hypothetical protein